MDLTAQAKVLRALQSGEISRVGSEHLIHVDVRVLAATNKDLSKEVVNGRFREDLFFRLNVFPIRCPALRERVEDIRGMSGAFVASFCNENGLRAKKIDEPVYSALESRKWPGNVRELKNVVERASILGGDVITIADLPEDPHENLFDDDAPDMEGEPDTQESAAASLESSQGEAGSRMTLRDYRDLMERKYIVETLRVLEWNISRTAITLGVERTNLHKKIRSYGIKRNE